ncbi:MAG: 50S ribosomal protein L3 [Nitrososphaeria archaeon]
MGHRKQSAPRHGSLAFRPRGRAGDITPRVKNWADIDSPKPILLGFIGFKAGTTHAIVTGDNPKTPTFGKPVFRVTTIVASPPLTVCGIRLYGKDVYGEYALTEVYSDKLPKVYERVLPKGCLKKKFDVNALDSFAEKTKRVMIFVGAEPSQANLPQKNPIIYEVEVGGGKSLKERLDYAKSILGSQIRAKDVFRPGEYIDTIGITRGKGFQGPVKRFGIKKKQHKSRKSVRAVGCIGPWHPATVVYTVARAGQMGFSQRVEYGKRVLLADSTSADTMFNPKGGFEHFGVVKGDYLIIDGSVQGPPKRPVVMRFAIRKRAEKPVAPKIIQMSVSPIAIKGAA